MVWNRKGVPHKGWEPVGVTDLREAGVQDASAYATCEMCGNTGIRYVHEMLHPEYGVLAVGRFCAAKMATDYVVTGKKRWRLRKPPDAEQALPEAVAVQQADG